MTQSAKAQDPSMEEILASIRRIIADDDGTRIPGRADIARPRAAPTESSQAPHFGAAPRHGATAIEPVAAPRPDNVEPLLQETAGLWSRQTGPEPFSTEAERTEPSPVEIEEAAGELQPAETVVSAATAESEPATGQIGNPEPVTSPEPTTTIEDSEPVSAFPPDIDNEPAVHDESERVAAMPSDIRSLAEEMGRLHQSAPAPDLRMTMSRDTRAKVMPLDPLGPQPQEQPKDMAADKAETQPVGRSADKFGESAVEMPVRASGEGRQAPDTIDEARRQFVDDRRGGPLMSSRTSAAVDSAFNSLASTVLGQNSRTLEDLVREMLRPMLKAWLDDNLPNMVERLVKAEIERVSRGQS